MPPRGNRTAPTSDGRPRRRAARWRWRPAVAWRALGLFRGRFGFVLPGLDITADILIKNVRLEIGLQRVTGIGPSNAKAMRNDRPCSRRGPPAPARRCRSGRVRWPGACRRVWRQKQDRRGPAYRMPSASSDSLCRHVGHGGGGTLRAGKDLLFRRRSSIPDARRAIETGERGKPDPARAQQVEHRGPSALRYARWPVH